MNIDSNYFNFYPKSLSPPYIMKAGLLISGTHQVLISCLTYKTVPEL